MFSIEFLHATWKQLDIRISTPKQPHVKFQRYPASYCPVVDACKMKETNERDQSKLFIPALNAFKTQNKEMKFQSTPYDNTGNLQFNLTL